MPEVGSAQTATSAALTGISPLKALTYLRAGAEERGLTFEEIDSTLWRCWAQLGNIEIILGNEIATVRVIAESADRLQTLRDLIVQRIAALHPDLARSLVWSGGAASGVRPPNFRLVRVVETARIARSFVRVQLAGEKLENFARTALHFRLLLPAAGATQIEWPTVGANGQTLWPEGELTLHRPVYTIRNIDAAAGYFDVDIFLHEGGRATEWVLAAVPGDEVGIMGPGGGWYPDAGWLLLAGDETALPAIARILEGVPANVAGVAYIQVASPADRVDLAKPPGFEVNWLYRSNAAVTLSEKVLATPIPDRPDRFVWFGGEWEEAKLLRQHFRDAGKLDRSQFRIATYWTASSAEDQSAL